MYIHFDGFEYAYVYIQIHTNVKKKKYIYFIHLNEYKLILNLKFDINLN